MTALQWDMSMPNHVANAWSSRGSKHEVTTCAFVYYAWHPIPWPRFCILRIYLMGPHRNRRDAPPFDPCAHNVDRQSHVTGRVRRSRPSALEITRSISQPTPSTHSPLVTTNPHLPPTLAPSEDEHLHADDPMDDEAEQDMPEEFVRPNRASRTDPYVR